MAVDSSVSPMPMRASVTGSKSQDIPAAAPEAAVVEFTKKPRRNSGGGAGASAFPSTPVPEDVSLGAPGFPPPADGPDRETISSVAP